MEDLSKIERRRKKSYEWQRKWRAENPEKHKATAMRAYRKRIKKDPDYWRSDKIRNYMHKYRGHPDFDREMPELCECCGNSQGERALSLDHCHETGQFRGWLCHKCNTGIGMLGDSLTTVSKAVEYLKRME